MPTYAYRCRDCGHELEVHQGFADSALTVCPVCGGTLRKQYGTVGVTFNGSGFYRTDSRAAEKSGGEKSGSGEKSGGEKSGGDTSGSGKSSTDSAPASTGSASGATPKAPASGAPAS